MKRSARPKKKKQQQQHTNAALGCWLAALFVAGAGIFWVPWMSESSIPSSSDSYLFGFNNRIAILALGLSLLLATAARYLDVQPGRGYQWLQDKPRIFPPWKEAKWEYLVLGVISVIMASGLCFWSIYLVDPAWCEARWFIYGIDLLALGQVPCRDFMWIYGPANLYIPFWLSNLTHGTLSFEQSYSICLILFELAGFVGIFMYLRSLEIRSSLRPLVLLLCLGPWLLTTMGMQYTPVRFFILPAALIFMDSVARRKEGKGIGDLVTLGLGVMAAVGACLSLSPEVGISSAAGAVGYGVILFLRRSIARGVTCIVVTVLLFIVTLFALPGYLQSILDFTGGAMNFPFFPSVNNICGVGVALIAIPSLLASALKNSQESRAPLAMALACAGGMMLPAALGRCDTGHVAINSVIPTLMMFPAALAAGKNFFRVWAVAYGIIFTVIPQYEYWKPTGYLNNYVSGIKAHQFYAEHPDMVAKWKSQWDALLAASPHGKDMHWSKVLPYPDSLDQFTQHGTMLLTSWNEGVLSIARYLLLQPTPPLEYYCAYSLGATTPSQVAAKAKEDQKYPILLVPNWTALPLQGHTDLEAYRKSQCAFLSPLLMFPVDCAIKNDPYFPDTEYLRQMLYDYEAISRYGSFFIMAKRGMFPKDAASQ